MPMSPGTNLEATMQPLRYIGHGISFDSAGYILVVQDTGNMVTQARLRLGRCFLYVRRIQSRPVPPEMHVSFFFLSLLLFNLVEEMTSGEVNVGDVMGAAARRASDFRMA